MNSKWIKTLIVWVVLFAAIVWMVRGMDILTRGEPDELDYNADFLTLVERTEAGNAGPEEKTIKAIQVVYRDGYGLYQGSEL